MSPLIPENLRAAALRLPRLALPADDPGGPVGVGVSGGADSVYLLAALWADEAVRPRLRAYHFDHRVRGAESAADAEFVRALCAALGVPCRCGLREGEGMASEHALREARQEFFAARMRADGAAVLCTAHHADDVVETMLLRLARGAGLGGLSAPRAAQVFRDGHRRWRPLLAAGLAKSVILGGLTAAGLPWREDSTNALPIAARNRVRAWLAGAEPALGSRHREGFVLSSRILGEAHAALLEWARELGCVAPADGPLPVAPLRGRPDALIHVVLLEFLYAQGVADPSHASLEPLMIAIRDGADAQVTVRRRQVRLRAGRLSLLSAPPAPLGATLRELPVGRPDDESGLLAERVDVGPELWAKLSRGDISPAAEVYLCLDAASVLSWRGRAEGDRYHPLGAPGDAKLSDLLINRKVPLELRDTLPVVLRGGEIVWVPGLPPAESTRLDGPAKGALRLTWLGPCLG